MNILNPVHRSCPHARFCELLHQLPGRELRRPTRQVLVYFIFFGLPPRLMLEGFILRPLRIPHGLDQCPPLVIRRHGDSYPAILSPARVYAMRSGCRMAVPCALHSPPVRLKLQQGRGHELQPRLVLSQIYVGTLTGPATMVQSREYGNQAESHTNEVYIWAIEETGICVRIAGEMREPRQRSELRTESRMLGMGSGLSLITATKHDQRWIHFCQFLISQTQAAHSPRREVLYHHVGPSHLLPEPARIQLLIRQNVFCSRHRIAKHPSLQSLSQEFLFCLTTQELGYRTFNAVHLVLGYRCNVKRFPIYFARIAWVKAFFPHPLNQSPVGASTSRAPINDEIQVSVLTLVHRPHLRTRDTTTRDKLTVAHHVLSENIPEGRRGNRGPQCACLSRHVYMLPTTIHSATKMGNHCSHRAAHSRPKIGLRQRRAHRRTIGTTQQREQSACGHDLQI